MAKRNIFNISDEHLQKEAFVQAVLPLLRAALPYLGRAAWELGKTVAVEKAISMVVDQVSKKGMQAVISSLTKGEGRGAEDMQKLLSGVLGADPKSKAYKSLIPDSKTRNTLQGLLDGLASKETSRPASRRGGGIFDALTGRDGGGSGWRHETNPFREPENVRLARRGL